MLASVKSMHGSCDQTRPSHAMGCREEEKGCGEEKKRPGCREEEKGCGEEEKGCGEEKTRCGEEKKVNFGATVLWGHCRFGIIGLSGQFDDLSSQAAKDHFWTSRNWS